MDSDFNMNGVTLAFGSVKKVRKVANVHGEEIVDARQQISEFSGQEAQRPAKKAKIIPCLPNASKHVKSKPESGDVGSLTDKFEAAIAPDVKYSEYGLVASSTVRVETREPAKMELKMDVLSLPDAPEALAYEQMPVEDFGRALLLGMGYSKATDVAPIEYIARPSRMGLGVKPGDVGMSVI